MHFKKKKGNLLSRGITVLRQGLIFEQEQSWREKYPIDFLSSVDIIEIVTLSYHDAYAPVWQMIQQKLQTVKSTLIEQICL